MKFWTYLLGSCIDLVLFNATGQLILLIASGAFLLAATLTKFGF